MTVTGAPPALAIVGPPVLPPELARPGFAATAYANSAPPPGDATWIAMGADGRVTAFAGKVEYGQGIRTGLAVEVADELRVALADVEVVLADTDRVPWDMGTFGSQSTARVGLQLRKAAATARETLLDLAADRFDLPRGEVEARDGRVVSRTDPGKSAAYAELLEGRSIERKLEDQAPLTAQPGFTVMGREHLRIDAVARVTGAAVYSQDVQLPGMLFAKVLRPPVYGARLDELDASTARQMPGVVDMVRDGDLAAVLATSDEAAEIGLRFARATWTEPEEQPGRWDIPRMLLETADGPVVLQDAGSLDDGFRKAAHVLEATYFVPYVSTVPMEPRAAVAEWAGGRLRVWAGTQRPFGVRTDLAQHFGIDESQVHVIVPEVGGGFGNKSIYPTAVEAARLARLAGAPVRVAFTRAEEMSWSSFRAAAMIEVKSGFSSDGQLVAWSFSGRHAARKRPMIAFRGAECPYAVPNVHVEVAASDGPLTAGSYRSLGGAINHFATESHMDEIAALVGADPVELRLRNLTHPRFRKVLEQAATDFGWPAKARPGRGIGVAIGIDVGSYVGLCAEVHVQGSEVRVERISAALDCGLVVNPDGARNQVEGSIVMGLGPALYEAIEVEAGRLLNPGFTRYRVPRITDSPRVDVALVGDPTTPSTGAGEPAIVCVAPALANAVFDQTGRRFRELPLQRQLA